MRCPRCQKDNPPQAKFCLECGRRLESEASAELRFASPDIYTPRYLAEKILTSRAALEGERKHVTVLFCDIAGSTVLAHRLGPESMHELLNRFFDLALAEVHRYEGTVNQFLGDGFMALFGAPLAHEDHAQRAVLTAAEVRRRLSQELGAELAVRMGLHTGVVVVGAIGDDLRMDYTAVGDTTHLAARLQQLAEPGTIVLSDATYRLVETLVEANHLGRQEIKGLGPQLVHQVERLAPAAARFDAALRRGLTPLVGRRPDLERLERCYDEAAAGTVRGVHIVGEAGIGKSRLLYEFRQRCPEDKVAVLRGACSAWGGAVPFRPFVEVVRNAFGLGAGDTTGEIERKLRRGLEALGLDADPALPFLLNLLGLDPDSKAFQGLDGEIIGARTREVLQTLLREQARRSPVVLAIDDAHWIDSPSEDLIRRTIETSEQLPLLVLCAHRLGYRPPWAGLPQVTEIRLDPLSEDHAVDLVRHRLGGREVAAHVARLVVERAEGNPLFAEELSRYLLESGALREGAEGRVGAEAARMPATLQDLVMARVDRLSDGPRALLQVASVVGRRFRLDIVADAAQVDGQLTQYVRDLEAQELIFRQERDGGDEYRFRHVLIQEAVYESLLTARRELLHERIADAIERHYGDRVGEWAEALAHHWSQTRRVDKAVRYMGLAGEKSLRLYAVEEAHERFRRVVQLVEAHPGYADDRFLADVLLAWCRTYYYLKDVPNFIALSRYLPRVEALDDRRRLSLFLFWIGFAHVFPPFPDKARPLLERALSLGEALGDDECIGYACMGLTFLHLIKPEPTARELALRGLACGERLGDVYLMSKCLLGLVNYDSFTGRYQRAREFALRGVDVGRRAGDPRATALGLGAMAIVNLSEERFTEAVENIEEALRISPDPLDRVAQRLIKGVALGLTGETAAGVAMAREGIRDLQAADAGEVAAWFEVPFGVALVLSGQLATGVRWIEETIPRAVKEGRVWRIAAAHLVLGEIYLEMALGEKKSPLPVLLKNAGFILKRLPFARRLARRHLRDAAHCARQADFPGVLARSLFDLGVLARRSKRFEEARRCFNDARVLADPHSATLTQRIREALASLP